MCLSILGDNWVPTTTVRDILLAVQDLLVNPDVREPAQAEAFTCFSGDIEQYEGRVRAQARELAAPL